MHLGQYFNQSTTIANPFLSNSTATAVLLNWAARWRAVQPSLSTASTLAPWLSSTSAISASPDTAAMCSADVDTVFGRHWALTLAPTKENRFLAITYSVSDIRYQRVYTSHSTQLLVRQCNLIQTVRPHWNLIIQIASVILIAYQHLSAFEQQQYVAFLQRSEDSCLDHSQWHSLATRYTRQHKRTLKHVRTMLI